MPNEWFNKLLKYRSMGYSPKHAASMASGRTNNSSKATRNILVAALVIAVITTTTVFVLSTNSSTSRILDELFEQQETRIVETDASTWYQPFKGELIPWDYTSYIIVSTNVGKANAYYRITANESRIRELTGIDSLYMSNGTPRVFRGVNAYNYTVSAYNGITYMFRSNGVWWYTPKAIVNLNQTYHESKLLGIADTTATVA